MKAIADDNMFKYRQVVFAIFEGEENMVGKGENAGDWHFFHLFYQNFHNIFPPCFQNVFS